jgi:hypothetical protein
MELSHATNQKKRELEQLSKAREKIAKESPKTLSTP